MAVFCKTDRVLEGFHRGKDEISCHDGLSAFVQYYDGEEAALLTWQLYNFKKGIF